MIRRTAKRWLAVAAAFVTFFVTFMWVTSFYPLAMFNPIWGLIWGSGYNAAIRSGPSEIGPVSQFVELFPDARHSITYYTGQMGQPQWTSTVGLHGRYVLTVQTDIEFDWSRRHVKSHGPPRYILVEVRAVSLLPDGTTTIESGPTQVHFGPKEWERLYRAGGDLSVLGITVVKDQSVAHFERAWQP
jgi:hypothetical protein